MIEDFARFSVLLENIDRNQQVLAEGHIATIERIDRMESRFDRRFDTLETKVVLLEVFAADAKQRFDGIETKIDRLETKVDQIDARIGRVETKVDQLDARVGRLETKVDQIDARLGRVETKVDQLETKVDQLETKVDQLETFAIDAQGRLKRIEGHLQLSGPRGTRAASSRLKPRSVLASKHRKKS